MKIRRKALQKFVDARGTRGITSNVASHLREVVSLGSFMYVYVVRLLDPPARQFSSRRRENNDVPGDGGEIVMKQMDKVVDVDHGTTASMDR
jgi:hypothetical protein